MNGGNETLPQALQANGKAIAGASNPTPLKSWTGPISNDPLTIAFKQPIAANDPLRTGSYSKTLTSRSAPLARRRRTDLRLGHEVRGQGVPFREREHVDPDLAGRSRTCRASSIGPGPVGSR